MKPSDRTTRVLICVLVIIVLVLAALVLSRSRVRNAAFIGGAALHRSKTDVIGGAVGDIWDETPETVSAAPWTLPARQVAHEVEWDAARVQYAALHQATDTAFAADLSLAIGKGAGRMLGIGRTPGTWRNAYLALDGIKNGLETMVNSY